MPDHFKCLIIIGIISIIGIIVRWHYVIDSISKGFKYFFY